MEYRQLGRTGISVSVLSLELATSRVQPLLPKVDRVLASAGDPGCTPSQLALAYCLQNPQVSSLLFGARRVVRMSDNLGALAVVPRPTPDVLAALRTL